MNKITIFLFLFIFSWIKLSAQFDRLPDNIFTGKLPKSKIDFLKKHYDWQKDTKLIINFKTYRRTCHYDQYPIKFRKKENGQFFDNFYKKIGLQDVSLIYILLEKRLSKRIIGRRSDYYFDKDDFLSNTFKLQERQHCYAITVIDENGNLIGRIGEYSEDDLLEFIEYLDKKKSN